VGVLTRDRVLWVECAVLAGAYVAAAKFGLELSVAHGVITPVWAPAGIAIGALLVRGPRVWPAIAVGAVISNATSGASLGISCVIAVGDTAEALIGWYLLRRVRFRPSLERTRDVLSLTVLAGFAATAVAATNGVTALWLDGSPAASPYGSAWTLWWLGDAMGVLLVAPTILVWSRPGLRLPGGRRAAEAAALGAVLVGASATVFLAGYWRYPYPIFALLVLVTLRFQQRGAATGSFVVAAAAVTGAITGNTPLGESATREVQTLQGLIAFVAVSLLVLGATLTERDAATRRLRHAAASLAEAQQLAHVGSWEWDVAGDRITWSDELYRIYGLDPQAELTYDTYIERVHPDDRATVQRVVQSAADERRSFEMSHRVVLPDGRERAMVGRGRVIVDASGRTERMVGTAQDVTEQRAAEALRESILSTVSHELRTPLTSVLGFALTLRERGDEIDASLRRELVEQIVLQAVRLERLLGDLLDVDRLRHGLMRVVREPTDLAMLVTRVAVATGHRVELEGGPLVAEVDPPKLERIVENLIVNAVKHTPPGTPITFGIDVDGADVVLRVDDRGPGVTDADKETIFDLFARGSAAGDASGTGIGLALVSQFAALHGGRVWVEDRPGGGASFRVLLPDCAVGRL
jgi:PAS domain S-box-containing protein